LKSSKYFFNNLFCLSYNKTFDSQTQTFFSIKFVVVTDFTQPEIEERVWHMEESDAEVDIYYIADGSRLIKYEDSSRDQIALTAPGEFTQITGFSQVNATTILLVDSLSHCLKWFDVPSSSTSLAAGSCNSSGYVDGELLAARFNTPRQVTRNNQDGSLYLSDSGNNAIRLLAGELASTMITLDDSPHGIYYDNRHQQLYVTTTSRFIRINPATNIVTPLIESTTVGFKDGGLNWAQMNSPFEIKKIARYVILVADTLNNRLRVVNTRADTVSSICSSDDEDLTSIDKCNLYQPLSLMRYKSGAVLIGGNSSEMKLLNYVLGEYTDSATQ